MRFVFAAVLLAAMVDATPPASAQAAKAGSLASEWHQFRGPNRDGISPDTGLLQQWPSSGPPVVWKATGIGGGYSSVCVFGTRVYTMGDIGNDCCLVALNASDGKIAWTLKVGPKDTVDHPGVRSTPATDGKSVFGLSTMGDLVCADAATGRQLWRKNLKSDFGGKVGGWGYSESPLIDGNFVVVTPGGSKGTVVALTKAGQTVWQSAQLKDDAEYTSLLPVDIGRIKQYIVFTLKSVAGIAAGNGQVAWRVDRQGGTAIAATPVYKDGMVFVSSGYGVGHTAFRVAGTGGRFQAQKAYEGKELLSHHGGFVVVGEHVYGPNEGNLVCMELKTGKVAWQDRCVGKGSAIAADGHLIVRGEGGGVALVEASPAGYKEKGRFSLAQSGPNSAWANPVVVGGKLYLRDWDNLHCYDLKGK